MKIYMVSLLHRATIKYIWSALLHRATINYDYLWPPYVIGQAIIFCPVVSIFLLSFFFPRLISAAAWRILDVYHTSTRGVALVRI